MKKQAAFLFVCFTCTLKAFGQAGLQEVITDFTNLKGKNKVVVVEMPNDAQATFYRITVFQQDKVNTTDTFFEALRRVNTKKLTDDATYDFSQHGLKSNGLSAIFAYFFTDEKDADVFKSKGNIGNTCFKSERTTSTTGKLECSGKKLYIGLQPTNSKEPVTVKVEIVAMAGGRSINAYDRFPYSIQNETNGEVVYEISGDRTNWETFHVPSLRKAEFKLAKSSVYLRVSTREKITVEYLIDTGKKYRLFWNEELYRVDLGESDKKKP